jgi:hypothetical protein
MMDWFNCLHCVVHADGGRTEMEAADAEIPGRHGRHGGGLIRANARLPGP